MSGDTGAIVTAAMNALPAVLGAIMARHAADNPGAPPLTEAQALDALHQVVAQSLAKDAQLRADLAGRTGVGSPNGVGGQTFGGSTGE